MSAIGSIGGTSTVPGVDGFADLTTQEFIQIMFAELSNQDPFEPADSKAMVDQLASLRSIQADLNLESKLSSLVKQNEFAAAATLVGQVVGGVTLAGTRVIDLVVSVSNTADGPVLNMFDGSRIPFAWVEEVLGPLGDDPDVPDDDEPDPDIPGDDPEYISKNLGGDNGDTDGGDDTQSEERKPHPYRGSPR